MSFIETPRFPDDISYNSTFQTRWNTSVIATKSGHEYRNRNWTQSRKAYDIGYGTRTIAQLYEVIEFFEACGGRADAFRFKDWSDYKTSLPNASVTFYDQFVGTGDGVTTTFQLVKSYIQGSLAHYRTILKPVVGTVLMSVNDVEVSETADWTLDYTTGVVTFIVAPPSGQFVKWGGEFDVPVRFDTDQLEVDIQSLDAGNISIQLVEIRS